MKKKTAAALNVAFNKKIERNKRENKPPSLALDSTAVL